MSTLKRIDFLFGITGLLILTLGLIFFRSTLEFPIHDTYFVIDQMHIVIGLAVVFLLISLVYFTFAKFSRPLKFSLGLIHYLITIIAIVIFVFGPVELFESRRYTADSNPFDVSYGLSDSVLIIFGGLALGQLFFLVNFILVLFEPNKTKQ